MKRFDWFRYLPQLPDDDLWGIAVRGAGRARSCKGSPYPPREHPADHDFSWTTGRVLQGFQIVFISEGRGRFESRRTRLRPVEAGDAILVFPSVWHRYEPDPSTGWVERWVELDGPAVRRLLGAGLFDETRAVAKLRDPGAFKGQMDRLLHLVRGAAPGARTEAGAIGHLLLAQLKTQHGTGKPASPAAGMVAAAECLLAAAIDHPLPIPEIARRLGVGYSHLRLEFRSRTGLSPKRYLQRMRLERARRLLGSTADSIDKIAERIGFCSAFHLSAAFKKEFGLPPKHWRKQFGKVGGY
jgi:AraC-like DNA-binding protein